MKIRTYNINTYIIVFMRLNLRYKQVEVLLDAVQGDLPQFSVRSATGAQIFLRDYSGSKAQPVSFKITQIKTSSCIAPACCLDGPQTGA